VNTKTNPFFASSTREEALASMEIQTDPLGAELARLVAEIAIGIEAEIKSGQPLKITCDSEVAYVAADLVASEFEKAGVPIERTR
jgi:hypothetical protein